MLHFINDNQNVGTFDDYSGLPTTSIKSPIEFSSYGSHIDDKPKSYIGEFVVEYDLLDKCSPVCRQK